MSLCASNISQCPLPLEHASNKLNTTELIYPFQDLVIKDCDFSLSLLNHLLWGSQLHVDQLSEEAPVAKN